MKTIKPVYKQDYDTGYSIFIRGSSLVSRGIIWFTDIFESASFMASHVIIVLNSKYGMDASENGINYCYLKDYFDNEKYECVCREPHVLDEYTQQELRMFMLRQIGKPYDYTGLLFGFPMMLLTQFSNIVKPIRKLPVPFHIPQSRVCSAFVADCYKHTEKYRNVRLLREWHVSRITPAMLWNQFPYKPFRFDKQRGEA